MRRYFWPEPFYRALRWAGCIPHYPGQNIRGDGVLRATMAEAHMMIHDRPGHIAEVGVGHGWTAAFLNTLAPHRTLHLFDTFEGVDGLPRHFSAGTLDVVRDKLPHPESVVFHPGRFPNTVAELNGDELWALVFIDVNLYDPTAAALRYFWPRMIPGGFVFMHDYARGGDIKWNVRRAVAEYFTPEMKNTCLVLPDAAGSLVVRKP